MLIRDEMPADIAAIAALNRAAFGGESEADLIEKLRADGLVIASLVAQISKKIVGHVLFSTPQPRSIIGLSGQPPSRPWRFCRPTSARASARP